MIFEKTLKQTLETYGITPKKSLGQNFLLDQNITDKIIRLSLEKQQIDDLRGENVLEVGSGPGGLTRAILKCCPKSLTVVEADEHCIDILSDLSRQANFKIHTINQDALLLDLADLNAQNLQIVSNLPYNISVPLLTKWLKNLEHIRAMTLMFQKEVADRICAPIKTKDYGRLSVLAQVNCNIQKLMSLKPECFVPAPKVFSTVLLFEPLKTRPPEQISEKLEKLTALAFSGRRKMIRQSLKQIPDLEKICTDLNISLTARAEEITPKQYLQMAQFL
ncbi:MAG: 16S rRNA (adenine(1518)-N(6)/adenine(1519)-N(6))-dimethyltransferase RsmA [Alphaproteobacteria bacterium]|nr:16S rRNA (adenine(1518)-N(6)/adenine(1519)-N(6))-dimethyltransferase RsmA [Alphaproteobacteria bacterium]